MNVFKRFLIKVISTKAIVTFISRSPTATAFVLQSRASRLRASQPGKKRGLLYHIFKTLLEMIPGGLGPYGIGDAISFAEGVLGQEIGGRKLDIVDRIISFAAAAIPIVPATPFREAVRTIREHLEETVAKKYLRQ